MLSHNTLEKPSSVAPVSYGLRLLDNVEPILTNHNRERDHCSCHECMHPHTKQRLLDTFEVSGMAGLLGTDHDIGTRYRRIYSLRKSEMIVLGYTSHVNAQKGRDMSDSNISTKGSNDGHRSFYPWEWLENHPPLKEYIQLATNESPG